MKISTISFVCLGLALGCFAPSALGQAENNTPAAGPDLGPVLVKLDRVVAGLAKVSEDLAKLQKTTGGSAKDKSLKSANNQLTDLNASIEALAKNLSGQAKAARQQADAAEAATGLLKELVALQSAAAKKAAQPATPVKWEYKSIFGDSRVALEEEMNAFGKDGWEFFNITSFGRGSAAFARRPVK